MTNRVILEEAKSIEEEIRSHRCWLHAHAETGFEVTKTLFYVKNALEEAGYTPILCGKAGLVASIGHGKPVLLLRADMDGLPVQEESGVDFTCTEGRMHACGHDMHTAMLLGAAKILKNHESDLQCTVKLMFQPAEEIFAGCADMIKSGVLEKPKVDAAMMIHVTAAVPLPAGTILVSSPGVSAPAADYFTIRIQGQACHGSAPQNGVDPITAAAHILIALQEIQARELSASDEAVLTIGTFHGGDAENVIADNVTMGGTIRTYDEQIRTFLKERIMQIAQGVAAAFRTEAHADFGNGCPTLVNDRKLSEQVTQWLRTLLGSEKALTTAQLSPDGKPGRGGGSEDFAYISQQVPSLMLALCAGEPDRGFIYPQHHPKVRFDEDVLSTGSAVFAWVALQFGTKQ